MLMVVQASKLNLSDSSSSSSSISVSSSPHFTSLLFEPNSQTLALMNSNSSFSLYPSLPPFFSPSPQSQQTLIPSPITSSTFLTLQSNSNPPRTLFLVSAPHQSGAAIILRFYILCEAKKLYVKSRVLCDQKGFTFHENLGVLLNVPHGVSVKLYGSINVFAMYCVSSSSIWVFGAKIVDGEDGVVVKLIKCAVIECCVPVWSVNISCGYLMMGEDNGVRIFALRPLVKGRVKKHMRDHKNLKLNLPNGMVREFDVSNHKHARAANPEVSDGGEEITGAGGTVTEKKVDSHKPSVKLKSVKVKSSNALFLAFKSKEVEDSKSTSLLWLSAKAITIQALSPHKFLILDSLGNLHLLHLSNAHIGLNLISDMRPLTQTMKVQKLAVLPDISLKAQTVWITDGSYSVHMIDIPDMDTKNDKPDSVEKPMQLSVKQAIFAGEKIQDIVPVSANAILVLGQGGVFAYSFS